jgi:hypothetical protein
MSASRTGEFFTTPPVARITTLKNGALSEGWIGIGFEISWR